MKRIHVNTLYLPLIVPALAATMTLMAQDKPPAPPADPITPGHRAELAMAQRNYVIQQRNLEQAQQAMQNLTTEVQKDCEKNHQVLNPDVIQCVAAPTPPPKATPAPTNPPAKGSK